MPLKINVGLSRKVGESNYGSRGASVNVELELDSSLVEVPAKFHERIRQVYGLARTSLNEELNGSNSGHGHAYGGQHANGNGHTNGNGTQHANGNGAQYASNSTNGNGANGHASNGSTAQSNSQRFRPATQSQVKALHAIARNRRFDLAGYLGEHYHVNRPEDLDIKTASNIIETLNTANQPGS